MFFRWGSGKLLVLVLGVDGALAISAKFSDLEYAAKMRVTRRDRFLGEIEAVTSWSGLIA